MIEHSTSVYVGYHHLRLVLFLQLSAAKVLLAVIQGFQNESDINIFESM